MEHKELRGLERRLRYTEQEINALAVSLKKLEIAYDELRKIMLGILDREEGGESK